jgi:hypothetical protein
MRRYLLTHLELLIFFVSMPNCTALKDPNQGTAFHELVVLPTLAPELARPYHFPGTPEYIATQAPLHAVTNSARQGLELNSLYSMTLHSVRLCRGHSC